MCSATLAARGYSSTARSGGRKRQKFINKYTEQAITNVLSSFAEYAAAPDSEDFWLTEEQYRKKLTAAIKLAASKKNMWVSQLRVLCSPEVDLANHRHDGLGNRVVRSYIEQHRSALKFAEERRKSQVEDPEPAQRKVPSPSSWECTAAQY